MLTEIRNITVDSKEPLINSEMSIFWRLSLDYREPGKVVDRAATINWFSKVLNTLIWRVTFRLAEKYCILLSNIPGLSSMWLVDIYIHT